jgi:hypothetical protein
VKFAGRFIRTRADRTVSFSPAISTSCWGDNRDHAIKRCLEISLRFGFHGQSAQVIQPTHVSPLLEALPHVFTIFCGARREVALRFVIARSFREGDVVGAGEKSAREMRHWHVFDAAAQRA